MLWQKLIGATSPALPIEYVGSATSGAQNTAVNLPAGTAANDIVLYLVATNNVQALTPPTGYTELFDLNSGLGFALFYKVMGATPDTTVTTVNVSAPANVISVFRNVSTLTPIDNSFTSSTTADPPSITVLSNNAMAIAVVGETGAGAGHTITSPPSGYTLAAQYTQTSGLDVVCGLAYKLRTAAGTEDPGAFTLGANNTIRSATFALDPK